jgi:hypothetical protein
LIRRNGEGNGQSTPAQYIANNVFRVEKVVDNLSKIELFNSKLFSISTVAKAAPRVGFHRDKRRFGFHRNSLIQKKTLSHVAQKRFASLKWPFRRPLPLSIEI